MKTRKNKNRPLDPSGLDQMRRRNHSHGDRRRRALKRACRGPVAVPRGEG